MPSTAPVSGAPVGLCHLLGQAHAELARDLEQALQDSGLDLNFTQYLALKHLGEQDSMTPGELARMLDYDPGSLTRLLDKLQQAGYLQRAPHPSDRRSLRLELTAAARKKRARAVACANATAEKIFAGFSRAERRELEALLTRLLARLHAGSGPTART
ncbi:MAG: MarR family winged helix-turn-helix transcriptional regulator [Gammaproteobacteria bacterium]